MINLYHKFIYWLHRFLCAHTGICQGAEGPCFQIGYRVRQNTAYVDDEMNWVHLCPDCEKVNDEYWADMWSDYWSGRL